jgi:hypothetical protein
LATKDTAAILTIVGGVFYAIGGFSGAVVGSAFLSGLSAGVTGAAPATGSFDLFGGTFFLILAWGLAAAILIIVGGVVMFSPDPARRKRGSYLAIAMMIIGAVPTIGGAVIGFILTLAGGVLGLGTRGEGTSPMGQAFPAAGTGAAGSEGPRFCANCGAPLNPGTKFCSSCGQPVLSAPAGMPSPSAPWTAPVKGAETISRWWWLLPILLSWIGGLIAYFVLRDRNAKTARNMLIFSIVWTVVVGAITFGLFFVFFASVFGHVGAPGTGLATPLVIVSGDITVPSSNGPAVIAISALNVGNNPITGFTISSVSPNVGGIVNNFTLMYAGKPLSHSALSSGTSLPADSTGTGVLDTSSANPMVFGTTYTLTVTIYFQNGVMQIQTLTFTAQI